MKTNDYYLFLISIDHQNLLFLLSIVLLISLFVLHRIQDWSSIRIDVNLTLLSVIE